ncbi:bestrophin-4-like [Daphnia pulicaria]|uniref:bestrophin-4-like n=1 Tax=Daphnia pulicaria TaxID=35523 RepID=UPI001EEC01CC|nr:bestrophin-4-like [Daphnia pulicaria]
MNEHLNEHVSLTLAKSFEFAQADAHRHVHSEDAFHATATRKASQVSRKKSEMTRVPSLQAVTRTAPNTSRFDGFKTLFRWRGSIYKLVWRQFVIYYALYLLMTIVYEFMLDEPGRRHFEALTRYFSKSASTLNLMIMLGFFTSTTLQRLFTMQTAIPGTAKIISSFTMSLKPDLPEGSVVVRLYARWVVLSWILAFRSVSGPLREKYPDMISLQIKGILQPHERLILERAETEGDLTPRPLIVIDWMLLLLKECSTFNRYSNKSSSHKNVEMLMAFKKSCGNLIKFATKNMPHAVIQAVMIAVYYFGLMTMLARDLSTPSPGKPIPQQPEEHQTDVIQESIDSFPKYPDGGRPDHDNIVKNIILYFPLMPLIQFFIFFAWLTFGRMAVNPFGEDETDIDLDVLLESHIDDHWRLGNLYTNKLEDLFPNLPHKKYVDAALKAQSNKDKDASKSKAPDDPPVVPVAQPTSPVLNVIPSSPEMGAFSILGASAMEERNYETASPLVYDRRLSTAITIDDATRTDSLHVPIW